MQLTMVQFSAVAPGELASPGTEEDSVPGQENEGLEPIAIDLSDNAEQDEEPGILYRAAEFLMISITGCAPKR